MLTKWVSNINCLCKPEKKCVSIPVDEVQKNGWVMKTIVNTIPGYRVYEYLLVT